MQRTFAIVKPDAFAAGHTAAILTKIQESGLRIVAIKTLHLSNGQAEGFYNVHRERPFFKLARHLHERGSGVAHRARG
jgi:nucleoside-diphosphate kinase